MNIFESHSYVYCTSIRFALIMTTNFLKCKGAFVNYHIWMNILTNSQKSKIPYIDWELRTEHKENFIKTSKFINIYTDLCGWIRFGMNVCNSTHFLTIHNGGWNCSNSMIAATMYLHMRLLMAFNILRSCWM